MDPSEDDHYKRLLIDKQGKLLALSEFELSSRTGCLLAIPYTLDKSIVFNDSIVHLITYYKGYPTRYDTFSNKWIPSKMCVGVTDLLFVDRPLQFIESRNDVIKSLCRSGHPITHCPDYELPALNSFLEKENIL